MSTITCFAPPVVRSARPVRTPRPARAAAPAAPVRLTRRGRALLAILCLTLVVAALALVKAPATASSDHPSATVAARVTVRPGETLWTIAARVRPNADPRQTIARIQDMNGLTSSTLQAGRVLLVPAAR
ncbi:MAG: hypothetical protein QOH80_152 [Actinomycetota bacterium]|jgi:Tfp pilus assembly protein FimV|nr:hypothetical protein [Actinomycetota bacterium]